MKILKVLGKQSTLFLELSSIINITTKLIPSGQHLRPYHIFMILFLFENFEQQPSFWSKIHLWNLLNTPLQELLK